MTAQNNIHSRMNIIAITFPILIENMLRYFFSFVDMAMLSHLSIDGISYGDDAVASVGLTASFMFFIIVIHMMVNSGSGIVITQYNGANKKTEATNRVITSVVLSLIVGIAISIAMFFLAEPVLSLFKLSDIRHKFAVDYLLVYGSLSLGVALNSGFSAILRSYGYSKEPMLLNFLGNIINVFGNYCFIFGAFGFPQWGVFGVALSTIVSQSIAALLIFIIILSKEDIDFPFKLFFKIKLAWAKEILRVGVPTAGEFMSYNVAQIVMNFFVVQMDPAALPAYNYAFLFARFIIYFGFSIGQGTQIIVSYFVGAGKLDDAYHGVFKYWSFSFFLAIFLAIVVSVFRKSVLAMFPMDPEVFSICSTLILFTMLLEPGRTFNLVIIAGLKGAGDVHFPVRFGILSMWGIGVVFAYLLGVKFSLGVVGIWIGISMDEWIRGIIMFFRWRSRIWESKAIATKE